MSIPGGFTLPVRNRKPSIPVIAEATLKRLNIQLSTYTMLGIGDVFLIFTYPFSAKAVPMFCLYVLFNLGLSTTPSPLPLPVLPRTVSGKGIPVPKPVTS